MLLLIIKHVVPFQPNRLRLVRLLAHRTRKRQTSRHLRRGVIGRHRFFEVQQDPTTDEAVHDSGGGTHKPGELGLYEERTKLLATQVWGSSACRDRFCLPVQAQE